MERPTHCLRGHPLDPDAEGADVHVCQRMGRHGNMQTRRECRHCDRIRARAKYKPKAREGYDPERARRMGKKACTDVAEEWEFFAPQGYTKAEVAAKLDMTYAAFDRALYRAAKVRQQQAMPGSGPKRGAGRMPERDQLGRFIPDSIKESA